jgi:hypothetical protein
VFTDECDYIVAETLDEALHLWKQHSGEGAITDPEVWDQLEDSTPLKIYLDADGKLCDSDDPGSNLVTKTAAEWTARGKGYLCTVE